MLELRIWHGHPEGPRLTLRSEVFQRCNQIVHSASSVNHVKVQSLLTGDSVGVPSVVFDRGYLLFERGWFSDITVGVDGYGDGDRPGGE